MIVYCSDEYEWEKNFFVDKKNVYMLLEWRKRMMMAIDIYLCVKKMRKNYYEWLWRGIKNNR